MKVFSILSSYAVPVFVGLILLHGLVKKVDLYAAFVKGAKGGAGVVFRVLPYVVGMLFAVEVCKAGGFFSVLAKWLSPVTSVLGIPAEMLPLVLLRPFSGGGSFGMLAGIYAAYGPDSFVGRVASTFMGSSETLFYTISLYFGSVGVVQTRYVVPVALATDVCGVFFSCLLCRIFF